jgi:hypothetical protein
MSEDPSVAFGWFEPKKRFQTPPHRSVSPRIFRDKMKRPLLPFVAPRLTLPGWASFVWFLAFGSSEIPCSQEVYATTCKMPCIIKHFYLFAENFYYPVGMLEISHVNDIRMKLINSGKYSDIFSIRSSQGRFAMKISYYAEDTIDKFINKKRSGDTQGAVREKNRDSIAVSEIFSKVTRALLNKKITPHFIRVIEEHDVKGFVSKIPGMEKRLKTLTDLEKIYNHVTFMDLFDTDLTSLLVKQSLEDADIRVIIFQVVYTLAAVQKTLPGFRHNDLSTNNILVKVGDDCPARYKINNTFFYTNTPYFVSITDYDFVHVPGVGMLNNTRITSGNYKVQEEANASYDVHLFLKSILKCLANNTSAEAHETRAFLSSLMLHSNDRYKDEIQSLVPARLLAHAYFKPLRTPPEHLSAEPTPQYAF